MAGLQVHRDTVFLVEQWQIMRRHEVDLKPMAAKVVSVAFAAATLWVPVERDMLALVSCADGRGDKSRGSSGEKHQNCSAVHGKPLQWCVVSVNRLHLMLLSCHADDAHHPAFLVVENVAVKHPVAGIIGNEGDLGTFPRRD